MPRKYKKRAKRQFRKKKTRTDARVKTLAKQAVNSMKPMKRLAFDSNDTQISLANNQWYMWQPAYIGGGPANSTSAENVRLSNQIWLHRFSGIAHIQIQDKTMKAVEVRKMCGWYKGSTDATDASIQGFGIAHLHTSFPNRIKRYDPDNFKILEDRTWTATPKFIYDSTSGEGAAEGSGLQNDNRSIWSPMTVKCNWNLNRVFRYSGSNDNQSEESLHASAATLVGWKPFFAIQIRCPQQAFTDITGNNPSPVIDYKFTSYFKDNV